MSHILIECPVFSIREIREKESLGGLRGVKRGLNALCDLFLKKRGVEKGGWRGAESPPFRPKDYMKTSP